MIFEDRDGIPATPARENEAALVRRRLAAWAGTSRERWRYLMILELAEVSNWSHSMIAMALGCTRPRVSQLLGEARREIRRVFEPSPRDLAGAGCGVAADGDFS